MLTEAMSSAQSAAPIVSDSSTHPGQLLVTGSVVKESTNIKADIAALHFQLADCQLTARREISDLMSQLKAAIQRQHVVQHLQAKLAEVQHSRQLISDLLQEIHWVKMATRRTECETEFFRSAFADLEKKYVEGDEDTSPSSGWESWLSGDRHGDWQGVGWSHSKFIGQDGDSIDCHNPVATSPESTVTADCNRTTCRKSASDPEVSRDSKWSAEDWQEWALRGQLESQVEPLTQELEELDLQDVRSVECDEAASPSIDWKSWWSGDRHGGWQGFSCSHSKFIRQDGDSTDCHNPVATFQESTVTADGHGTECRKSASDPEVSRDSKWSADDWQ